jgi:hypothetical protein
MQYDAGIDVSLEQSSVCVVDATGKIITETKVATNSRIWLCSSKNWAFR